MKYFKGICILYVLLVCAPREISAMETKRRIIGEVYVLDNSPMICDNYSPCENRDPRLAPSGIKVRAKRTGDGLDGKVFSARTAEDGSFRFRNLPKGEYVVRAEASNKRNVNLVKRKTAKVRLTISVF